MTAAPLPPPLPLRVLLLDDDAFMLALVHEMLNELGQFEVHAESCARRALQTLARVQPALLICDLSLPDMDGIEFLHAAAEARFGGCVMLLSGIDDGVRRAAERLARAHGLRVLGAFRKPLAAAALAAALAPLLAGAPGACTAAPAP